MGLEQQQVAVDLAAGVVAVDLPSAAG